MKEIHLSGTIIIKNNKLLLLYKIKAQHYELPGGKIKPNEDLKEAAIRETKEKIACTPSLIKYIGHNDFKKNNNTYFSHMFLANIKNQIPKINEPDKFSKLLWLQINDYKKFTLAPNVAEFCKNYIEKTFN